jgi:urease accessory protein
LAENRLRMTLEPGGELLGWDITALGLPGADLPFVQGHLNQHIELSGVWLDRAKVAASDMRLLNSPLGLDGQRCVASLFFVTGSPIERNRKQQALDCAREHIGNSPLARSAGVTSPNPQVMVVRVLAPVVEPAMQILRQVRDAWRSLLWCKSASSPRIWSM